MPIVQDYPFDPNVDFQELLARLPSGGEHDDEEELDINFRAPTPSKGRSMSLSALSSADSFSDDGHSVAEGDSLFDDSDNDSVTTGASREGSRSQSPAQTPQERRRRRRSHASVLAAVTSVTTGFESPKDAKKFRTPTSGGSQRRGYRRSYGDNPEFISALEHVIQDHPSPNSAFDKMSEYVNTNVARLPDQIMSPTRSTTSTHAPVLPTAPLVLEESLQRDLNNALQRWDHRSVPNAVSQASRGFELWRIEQMHPTHVTMDDFGVFYTGDSYICLHKNNNQDDPSVTWNIHFWIGKEASDLKAGMAANYVVELKRLLMGASKQYREVQGEETPLFLSYFLSGIQYVQGGHESGFRHVEPEEYTHRLIQVSVHGVRQVDVSFESLNQRDVFVLDSGLRIFVWCGRFFQYKIRNRALQIAIAIRDVERHGKAQVFTIEDEFGTSEEDMVFWDLMGDRGDDTTIDVGLHADTRGHRPRRLFVVQDFGDRIEIEEIAVPRSGLEAAMLDEEHAYVLDCEFELYVWKGPYSSLDARDAADQLAESHLRSKPEWVQVHTVHGNQVDPLFRAHFNSWRSECTVMTPADFEAARPAAIARQPERPPLDVRRLHSGYTRYLLRSCAMVTARAQYTEWTKHQFSGKLRIWRVDDLLLTAVPEQDYGHFSMYASYLVHYSYQVDSADRHLLYYWHGMFSSDVQNTICKFDIANLITSTLENDSGHAPLQMDVLQSKEPDHFLALFQGWMVVYNKMVGSQHRQTRPNRHEVVMYAVRGNDAHTACTVQVEAAARSLSPLSCFLLQAWDSLYVWFGRAIATEQRTPAVHVANLLKGRRSLVFVEESKEPAKFWQRLGGRRAYYIAPYLQEFPSWQLRFFDVFAHAGYPHVREILNWSQADLTDTRVFLLDLYTQMFVWVGASADLTLKDFAVQLARDYIAAAPHPRPAPIHVQIIEQHKEPITFTSQFVSWVVRARPRSPPISTVLSAADAMDVSSSAEDAAVKFTLSLQERASELRHVTPAPTKDLRAIAWKDHEINGWATFAKPSKSPLRSAVKPSLMSPVALLTSPASLSSSFTGSVSPPVYRR